MFDASGHILDQKCLKHTISRRDDSKSTSRSPVRTLSTGTRTTYPLQATLSTNSYNLMSLQNVTKDKAKILSSVNKRKAHNKENTMISSEYTKAGSQEKNSRFEYSATGRMPQYRMFDNVTQGSNPVFSPVS